MSTPYKVPRNQDATATIRGFFYQIYQSIYLWLQLKENESLELEKGEDIDIILQDFLGEEERTLIQVKNLQKSITLRSNCVTESLFNYYQHKQHNPQKKLSFHLLTTAKITKERNSKEFPISFLDGANGISVWKDITKGLPVSNQSIELIKKIILNQAIKEEKNQSNAQKKNWKNWIDFLTKTTIEDFKNFISGFSFLNSQMEMDGLKDAIGFLLKRKGIAKDWNEIDSIQDTFLAYTINKLSQKDISFSFKEIEEVIKSEQQPQLIELKRRIKKLEEQALGLNSLLLEQQHEYPNPQNIELYNKAIQEKYKNWNIPSAYGLENISKEKFNPTLIHSFQRKIPHEGKFTTTESPTIKFPELENQFANHPIWVWIGATGSGKTSFLKYLTSINTKTTHIPIFISLRKISANRNLKALLLNELHSNQYPIKEEQLLKLLGNFSWTILLDAFDEVEDALKKSLIEEISEFSQKCKILITTRSHKIPKQLPRAVYLDLKPLDYQTVRSIIEKYIGKSDYYDFFQQIRNHGLTKETTNILLLLLFIAVYQKHNFIPSSNSVLVDTIVTDIFKWIESKKLEEWFTKELVEEILQIIAFEIQNSGGQTTLSRKKTSELLKRYREEKIDLGEIPESETTFEFKKKLGETGLIIFEDSGESYFWHRLFLHHFASKSLAKKIENDQIQVTKLSSKSKWITPLSICVSKLPQALQEKFLFSIKENLWLLAECLKNTENPNQELLKQTIQKLKGFTFSKIIRIRLYAIHYLILLNQKHTAYTHEIIWNLFKDNPCVEVRKKALLEIAKEKTNESKELVFNNTDWDETSFHNPFIGTREEVLEALSYYGEDGFRKIFELSKGYQSIISHTFSRVFSDLITFNKLPEDLIEEMFQHFISDSEINEEMFKYELETLLSRIKKEKWVPKLINIIHKSHQNKDDKFNHSPFVVTNLLKKYDTNNCLNQLWKNYSDSNTNIQVKKEIASIILEFSGEVPLEYFLSFLNEDELYLKQRGIEGLGRFEFQAIKPYLIKCLNDDKHQIHHSALEIAVEKGFIVNLLEEGFITNRFIMDCNNRNDLLLKAISKYNLADQIELAREMANENCRTGNTIKLYIEALILDGQFNRAVNVFKKIYFNEKGLMFEHDSKRTNNSYFQNEIFEILAFLPSKFVTVVLTDLYKNINFIDCNNCRRTFAYKLKGFCENSTSNELNKFLKPLISKVIKTQNYLKEEIDILRNFVQAYSHLVQNSDENWLLLICKEYKTIPKEILNKLLYQLATICRTSSALKLAKKIANWTDDELTLHYCYEIHDGYYQNNGILKQVKESEIYT